MSDPRPPRRLRFGAAAVAVLVIASCGENRPVDEVASPATSSTTTPATLPPVPTTTEPAEPSDLGGFGPPAAAPDEFGELPGITMTGVADQAADGCWYLSGSGEEALLVAPVGTALDEDGVSLRTPDGTVIEHGTAVDATGGMVEVVHLPGGDAGRWADYVRFCGSRYPFIVVADTLVPAFDPDTVDASALAAELDADLFDTDHGCGFGFTTGDSSQRWRLEIFPADGTPPEPGTVRLPDHRFVAEVVGGAHLFANHCDDVFEWFEPVPKVAVDWPVIAGEFTYPEASPEICSGQPPQTITLSGAIVETPIGPVELDPIEITNTGFGCFAG